ncbi:MAG: RIP metalloprotease RseP [Flavobacteriales bacterium]|jgi:regulator of sigma E protease|nr:RIP metalloprotease RseP [Flavobacteriales bacterium]
MEILIKAAQFILSLSIIVTLHEMGHFIPARWFKVRVEKFYLFFDPWFSLWKKKIGDTEYGVGWLPLGGYVKLAGMVDESMDKEQMARPPQPWEFRSKPAWQRLVIMVGGVTVNLLLGMLIYIGVLYTWGKEYLPLAELRYGVHPAEVMKAEGFEDGDRIVAVDGRAPATLEEVPRSILIDGARQVTVERGGETRTLQLAPGVEERILASRETQLFVPCVPFVVDTILPGGGAAGSGLRKGDRIVGVDAQATPWFLDFKRVIAERAGERAQLTVERGGERVDVTVQVDENGLVGVGNRPLGDWFNTARESYGLLASIPAGIKSGWETLTSYVRSMKLLFSKSGASQIGGFGTIGSLFSPDWDWQLFWNMTAFLSIILAFMNILPIPALDGGHVMFLLYEMIAGKPAPQRVMEAAQLVGMVLLLGLLLFANANDVFRAFGG